MDRHDVEITQFFSSLADEVAHRWLKVSIVFFGCRFAVATDPNATRVQPRHATPSGLKLSNRWLMLAPNATTLATDARPKHRVSMLQGLPSMRVPERRRMPTGL